MAKYLAAAEAEGIAQDGPAPSDEQLSRLATCGQVGARPVAASSDGLLESWADQIYQWAMGDWTAAASLDQRLLDAAFSLEFLDKREHVLFPGPAGVGKSFMAQALGYAAVRAGHTVRFVHVDGLVKVMAQARVDNSVDRTFRSFLSQD